MPSPSVTAARFAVAAAWLHRGLYGKILQGDPRQRESVADMAGEESADAATLAIGAGEVCLAIWALSGVAPRACATAQTATLVGMTAAQLSGATSRSGDPERLLLRSAGICLLAWLGAGRSRARARQATSERAR